MYFVKIKTFCIFYFEFCVSDLCNSRNTNNKPTQNICPKNKANNKTNTIHTNEIPWMIRVLETRVKGNVDMNRQTQSQSDVSYLTIS